MVDPRQIATYEKSFQSQALFFVWDDSSGRTTRKMSGNKDQITQSYGDIMDTVHNTVHKFLVVFWEDNHTKRRMTIMTTKRKI